MYFALTSGKEIARKIIDSSYSCPELEKMLKMKKGHEKVLSLLNFLTTLHPSLALLFAKALLPLTNKQSFRNKIINKFS